MQLRQLIIALLISSTIVACGGEQKSAKTKSTKSQSEDEATTSTTTTKTDDVIVPKYYDYRVVAEYPHATSSYTQGLEYVNGVMWEGTGMTGESQLQQIDLATGKVKCIHKLDDTHFGEGITHFQDRIYQLTWEDGIAYVYDNTGKLLKNIPYKGEGWGITTDGQKLYMSDGGPNIYVIDPETFAKTRIINVKYGRRSQSMINELEWIDGKIWANIYLENKIIIIDPSTGAVEAYLDLRSLNDSQHGNHMADVLNGIAYDSATGHIFVTGKRWNKLFEIEVKK